MIKVNSKALKQEIEIDRVIGNIQGNQPGPTLIFVAGIHGNEPAGVFALKRVCDFITSSEIDIKGNIFFVAGNLNALKKGIRFQHEDLNRVWTKGRMELLPDKMEQSESHEVAEQIEINNLLREILKSNTGPFYFFDIHTTSSETIPFLTVNDSLLNRAFTSQYPIPIILGIEEYLNGPILSYMNAQGYVAFGFEAGQHDDLASIENAEAFSYLSMIFTGNLPQDSVNFQHFFNLLAKNTGDVRDIYEIFFRYGVKENEAFKMEPGFYNFQRVQKKQLVATSNGKEIRARKNGRIFMPLYQNQGSDGFFAIRKIKSLFLNISTKLRKYKLDRILVFLPGVRWLDERQSALVINKSIARFLAKQLMHLLGYRSIEYGEKYYLAYNRESESRTNEYKKASWFNKLYESI